MFARHSLAWLSDQGWRALRETAGETDRSAIDLWRAAGWPATVRRRDVATAADHVCLGLASPPDPIRCSFTSVIFSGPRPPTCAACKNGAAAVAC